MNWEPIIWLGLMVVFILAEAACPVHLISIWFAVGALAATIVSLLAGPVWLQVVLFLVVSCVLLALLWPLAKKYFTPKLTKTNVDAMAGSEGYVTADIDNVSAVGQVKLGAMEWSARSSSGDPIPAGTRVRVDRVEGVKVYVTPVKTPAQV